MLILLQIPFLYAIYQSYELNIYLKNWVESAPDTPFRDLRGGIHVHSAAGGHSLGTYPEIIEAAKSSGYDFLFITEHPRQSQLYREIEDPELVVIYGWEEEAEPETRILTDKEHRVRFLSHFRVDQPLEDISGLEIYNIHENAVAADNWFNRGVFLYHQISYPGLFFFHLWEIDRERLQKWDQALAERHLTAIAGNDAHQNVGIILQSASGDGWFSLLADPYRESLKAVATHVLLPGDTLVSEESILHALEQGTAYVAFEKIGDPTGFSFHARHNASIFPMGSSVPAGSELLFQSPVTVRFRIIRNGEIHKELEGTQFTLQAQQPGAYRLEVYPLNPPGLLEGKPWIFSNAIYVR